LLANVQQHMTIAREAISGPVACVMSFNTTEEAIAMANDSQYGLLAAVFTATAAVATEVRRRLEVGAVYVNNFQRIGVSADVHGSQGKRIWPRRAQLATLGEFTRQRVVRVITQPGSHYWAAVDELLSG
jgi:acyl-CoA reductase-like NAD-dependent aldehyde dehydrogenase